MILRCLLLLTLMTGHAAFAESACDVRPGKSVGIDVIEFVSGNTIHSKIPMSELSISALQEEMINLQDMGTCEEKITSQKCTLRFEKKKEEKLISFYRGTSRWSTWSLQGKTQAQDFVKNLKRLGYCS